MNLLPLVTLLYINSINTKTATSQPEYHSPDDENEETIEFKGIKLFDILISFVLSCITFFVLNIRFSEFFSDVVNKGFIYKINNGLHLIGLHSGFSFMDIIIITLLILQAHLVLFMVLFIPVVIFGRGQEYYLIKTLIHIGFLFLYSITWFFLTISGMYKVIPYAYFVISFPNVLLIIKKTFVKIKSK